MDINELKQKQIYNFKSDGIVNHILLLVKKEKGYTLEQLRIKSRKRELVFARQIAMFLLARNSKHTLDVIGNAFNRNHATVLHARKTISNLMDVEKPLKITMELLEDEISAYKSESKTKLSIFKELLEKLDIDEEEKNILLNTYLEAV